MIDWTILNIEETTDEAAITAAYRRMLTMTNPEDNPTGFMMLRKTYEEAISYAKNSSMSNTNNNAIMGFNTSNDKYIYENTNNQGFQNINNQGFNKINNQGFNDSNNQEFYDSNKNGFINTENKENALDKTVCIDNIKITKGKTDGTSV